MTRPAYDAVLFDLLTALLDSWSLWNAVAGDAAAGQRWRREYLRITYACGPYRPYEVLVAEAAETIGLSRELASTLDARYAELEPWPGVTRTLQQLAAASVPMGVVTNCSERLGRIAAAKVGVPFAVVVTAEQASFYKPDPRPYEMALRGLGVAPSRCLFVAGSPYDLAGTASVGLPAYWHDRSGLPLPDGVQAPLVRASTLDDLAPLVIDGVRPSSKGVR